MDYAELVAAAEAANDAGIPMRLVFMLSFLRENKEQLLSKTSIDPSFTVLGCGSYGCVFSSTDKDFAIKITVDEKEGPLIKEVMEIRNAHDGSGGLGPSVVLPGFVFFHQVLFDRHRDPLTTRTRTYYVIEREAVRPMAVEGASRKEYAQGYVLDQILDDMRDIDDPDEEYPDDVDTLYAEKAEELYEMAPELAESLVQWRRETDASMQDVRSGNIGFSLVNWGKPFRKPGTLVLFDIGFTAPRAFDYKFKRLNPPVSLAHLL